MTDLRTHISLATESLKMYRLRSFLTILGLTMGVATLMTVITLIVGANTYVQEKIADLGTDVFRIAKTPFATTNFEESRRARRNPDVLREDMAAVRESCPLCVNVGATVSGSISVRYKNQETRDVSIRGQTPNMADIGTLTVERGRFFSDAENRHGAPVCLLGDDLTEQLFPGSDPIGREVRVGKDPMLVIGTFERIGSVLGNAQDAFIVVPLDTFFRARGSRHSLTLEIQAAGDAEIFERAQDQARVIMRSRRGITGLHKENFYIGTSDSYIELWETISSSFFFVFLSVSSIAAVVGGIVIMNIMLVSVTERTKEIGVRRACGANRNDIVGQFLAESLLQSLIGGTIGVFIGFTAALLLRQFSVLPATVDWRVAVLGVGLASSVGLFFGIYPAMKAADLDPIDALRSE
jgi:putative ABC transport system permease protein